MIRNALTNLASENNDAIKTLSETEQNEIDKSTGYVRAKGAGIYDSELFRKDLIGMYCERKLRGEIPDDLNTKEFCDSVIENCPKRRAEAVLYTLRQFSGTIFLWSAFDLFLYANPYELHSSTVLLYLLAIVFYFSAYYIFPRYTLLSGKTSSTVISLCVFLALMALVFCMKSYNHVLTAFPSGIWFVSHLLLFIFMKAVWDFYIYRLAQKQ